MGYQLQAGSEAITHADFSNPIDRSSAQLYSALRSG